LDFSFRLDGIDDILAAEATRREPLLPETDDPAVLSKPEASPLVAVKDYSFSYPDGTQALRKIHFKINRGESVAIVGENGAGKTTLLHCLLGILEGRGEHLFEGIPINRRRRRNLWRRIGIIFQDPADQLFCPTCAEEVAFGPRQMGVKKEALAQRVYQALTQVHLQGYEDRIPQHLSGGERKRLAIATVLAMQPDILILDEPTAGLDPQGEELLLNILQGLPQTRILVSHDPYLTAKLTQRTVVLHQGEIVRDYSTHEFLHDQDRARLNLLTLTSRREHCREIRALQHQHAHSHRHRHLHEHRHRHGDLEHSHPHEHEHNHAHTYIHLHGADTEAHCHPPRPRYHDHAHPHHEQEPHDHDHPEDH
jgi:energy-coupling factor transporter ATP-binding protein EcfA2